MILTKRQIDHLRQTNFLCAKLSDEKANELLTLFGKEPDPDLPYVWDEETIWLTIRKMTHS